MPDDPRWWKSVLHPAEWVKCETCQKNNAVGVGSVPGIPYSAAFCVECIAAGAYPWWLLVANQAAIGDPLETTAEWWQQMVADTCRHLGRTLDEFTAEVEEVIEEEAAEMQRLMMESNDNPPPKEHP